MKNNAISLDDIFSFINEKGSLIVAVSGGSDSMAALLLTNAWAKKTGRNIHAVTVDHGLRAEAASEAAFVAIVCDGLGIVHTTLAWDGMKPSTGISAAARNARYDLIEEFARDIGVRLIISGHTCDDQAETIMMRLARAQDDKYTSGRGHSGMCRRTQLSPDILLLRPFLQHSRAELRGYLNEISQCWIEDPSNFDKSYERVRVRCDLKNNYMLKENLLEYSSLMGRMRQVISNTATELLMRCCKCNLGHVFELDITKLQNAPREIVNMALKIVIAAAGGGEYLVGDSQLRPVLRAILESKLIAGKRTENQNKIKIERLTLGNCVIERDERKVVIYREARNLDASVIGSGESYFWDGRVHITNDSAHDIRIEAISTEYLREIDAAGDLRLRQIGKNVLLSSPLVTTVMASDFEATRSGSSGQYGRTVTKEMGSNGVKRTKGVKGGKKETTRSIALFFDKASLPAQLEVRTGARAIENFCPEWDFSLLEWLKNIDLATDQHQMINSDL